MSPTPPKEGEPQKPAIKKKRASPKVNKKATKAPGTGQEGGEEGPENTSSVLVKRPAPEDPPAAPNEASNSAAPVTAAEQTAPEEKPQRVYFTREMLVTTFGGQEKYLYINVRDNRNIWCRACDIRITKPEKSFVQRHVQTQKHLSNTKLVRARRTTRTELVERYGGPDKLLYIREDDNRNIWCKACNIRISKPEKCFVERHVLSTHKHKKRAAKYRSSLLLHDMDPSIPLPPLPSAAVRRSEDHANGGDGANSTVVQAFEAPSIDQQLDKLQKDIDALEAQILTAQTKAEECNASGDKIGRKRWWDRVKSCYEEKKQLRDEKNLLLKLRLCQYNQLLASQAEV